MKKPMLLVGLLTALVAGPASAETWYQLANSSEAVGYGDADSVEQSGDYVAANIVLGLREPMGKSANIEFLASSVRFSCSEARYFVVSVDGLGPSREVISSLPGSREWKDISEGSLHASFRDFACGKIRAGRVADPYAATDEFWRSAEDAVDSRMYELASQLDMG